MRRELTAAEKDRRAKLINKLVAHVILFIGGWIIGYLFAPSTLPMFRWACMPEYRAGPILNLNH